MGGFLHGIGTLLKTGFDMTPTGQRYQQVQQEKQTQREQAEKNDREVADYFLNRGAKIVGPGGAVQEDHVLPNGETLPGGLLRKADPARTFTHKTATGQKVQFEDPTPDERIGINAGRLAHQFTAEAPTREAMAGEQATNAGRTAQATAGGTYAAQNAQAAAHGFSVPTLLSNLIPGSDKNPDGSPRKLLPSELGPLMQGAESASNIQSQVETRKAQLDAAKRAAAAQSLSGVQDQAGLDQFHKEYPEAAQFAHVPTVYSAPFIKSSIRTLGVPVTEQPKYTMEELRTSAMQDAQKNMGNVDTEVDKMINKYKFPEMNNGLKEKIKGHLAIGDLEGAQKVKDEALSSIAQHEQNILQETDPRVINARVGQQIAVEKAKAALAPGGFSAIVDPAARNRAETEYDKSAKAAGDTVADARRVKALITKAQGGNPAASGVIPIAELRTFVNRVNAQELKQVSTGAGSVYDRVSGWIKGATTEEGPIPAAVLKGMSEIADLQEQLANQKHQMEVNILNSKTGAKVKPVDFSTVGAGPTAPKTIRARDVQGKLHEAPAGTALPAGWKLEP